MSSESSPPVAIIAFDGMQSQRCAAPPMMSRSIERDLGAERGRDRRRGVAAGATTDDHEAYGHRPRLRDPLFGNVPRMPELRYDAISGRSVIVAVERAARPFTVAPTDDAAHACPTTARSAPAARR